jgi:hypothetical protein
MVGRRLALSVSALLIALMASGCNWGSLSKRELVVDFSPSATTAQRAAVLQACGRVSPEAKPEPFSTAGPVANQVSNVRFRIDHANDHDIAQLETCLGRQPGVRGDHIPDLTN